MRILDGKMALGNKSGTKNLGEHKVGALFISFPPQTITTSSAVIGSHKNKHLRLSIVLEDPARSSNSRLRCSRSY